MGESRASFQSPSAAQSSLCFLQYLVHAICTEPCLSPQQSKHDVLVALASYSRQSLCHAFLTWVEQKGGEGGAPARLGSTLEQSSLAHCTPQVMRGQCASVYARTDVCECALQGKWYNASVCAGRDLCECAVQADQPGPLVELRCTRQQQRQGGGGARWRSASCLFPPAQRLQSHHVQ